MSQMDFDEVIPQKAIDGLVKVNALLEGGLDLLVKWAEQSRKMDGNISGASNLSDIVGETKKATDANKEYLKISAERIRLEEKKKQLLTDEAKETAKLRVEVEELTRKNKERAKEMFAEEGSLNKLRSQLRQATRDYDAMSKEMRENSDEGRKLKATIDSLTTTVSTAEQSTGRFQRQVGNYNLVGHEFNQLLRETPTLAIDFRTWLLSVSNNFPLFMDRVNMARAAGASWGQVLAAMGKQLFSLTGILTIGISLLTIYGKELFGTSEKMKVMTRESVIHNKIIADSAAGYVKAATELEALKRQFFDAKTTIAEKNIIVQELNNKYGNTIGKLKDINDAEEFFLNRSEAFGQALILRAQIEGAYDAIGENTKELLKSQAKDAGELTNIWQKFGTLFEASGDALFGGLGGGLQRFNNTWYTRTQQNSKRTLAVIEDDTNKANKTINGFVDKWRKDLADINEKFKFNFEAKAPKKEKSAPETFNLEAELRKKIADANEMQAKEEIELDKRKQQSIISNEKASLDDRIAARYQYYVDVVALLQLEEKAEQEKNDAEHDATVERINNTVKDEKEKNKLLDLENERYLNRSLALWSNYLQKQNDAIRDYKDKSRDDTQKSNDAELKATMKRLTDINDASAKAANDRKRDRQKELKDILDFSRDIVNAFQSVGDAIAQISRARTENEIEELRKESDELDKKTQREIEIIEQTTLSTEEKQKRIDDINARAEDKKQDLAAREAQRASKQAEREKGLAIATATIKTALAVLNELSTGDPYTAIARAIAAGVAGAAQIAAIAATPIPQYFTGRDGGPAELAIVGEKGMEAIFDDKGNFKYFTGDSPELRYLEEGDSVVPNNRLNELSDTLVSPSLRNRSTSGSSNNGLLVAEMRGIRHDIKNMPQTQYILENGQMIKLQTIGGNRTKYYNAHNK